MSVLPSNSTPLIFRVLASLVAATAVPSFGKYSVKSVFLAYGVRSTSVPSLPVSPLSPFSPLRDVVLY